MKHFSAFALSILLLSAGFSEVRGGEFNFHTSDTTSQKDKPATPTGYRTVTGTVIDEHNSPLVGVAIVIQESNTGVITDEKGAFSIQIPNRLQRATLVFSYVGMERQEVVVTTQKTVRVRMITSNEIEEVIVTGYGVIQKRSDLAGSAFEVTAKDIEMLPATRIDNLLTGQVPGLAVSESTDAPGSPRPRYNIRIRGEGSLSASNEPLWIIDGIPIYTGGRTNSVSGMNYSVSPLAGLNPDDIESMTVLKDASTTALFGANGANGVILITTKKGQEGKTTFNIRAKYGVSTIDESTRIKMMNAAQYMEYAKTAWVNAGYSLNYFPFQDNENNSYSTTDTDWGDVYYDIGQNYQLNFSATGGSKRLRNYFSGSYYRENSVKKGNTSERLTARSNTTFELNKWITARFDLSGEFITDHLFALSHEVYQTLPIFSPYNNDGTYRLYNYYNRSTTTYLLEQIKFFDNSVPERELSDNRQRAYMGTANAMITWTPIKGLSATTQIGTDYQGRFEDIYDSRNTLSGMDGQEKLGYSRRATALSLMWTNINRINFNRTFGKHWVNAVAGLELSSSDYHTLYATGSTFINDDIKEIGYATSDSRSGYSSYSRKRTLSYLGEIKYTYDDRYNITLNARRDGNSSFGKYARWGNFWSIGGVWNIHKEKFFQSNVINALNFRATYGVNGNSRIDNSNIGGTYTYTDSDFYNGQMGATQGTAPNPGLSWERVYTTNLIFDISLLNRIDLSLQVYWRHTVDMLYSGYASMAITDAKIMRNVGEMMNKGIELSINTRNIVTPDFLWTTRLNGSYNKNRILKLYNNMSTGFFDTVWMEGYDSNAFYLVEWAGVDPRDGSPMWYDLDGNITKTFNYANRVPGKSSVPTVSGGMTNNFQWKNFSLSILLTYDIGGWALTSMETLLQDDGKSILEQNTWIEAGDYWKQPGDLAVNPKVVSGNTSQSYMNSTRFLRRKTNVNIRNIALTYSLSEKICQKVGFKSCDISLIGDNVYLWTPGQRRGRNSYKTLMNPYPVTRTISASVGMSF